jgi:hypothetical protein
MRYDDTGTDPTLGESKVSLPTGRFHTYLGETVSP